MGGEEREVQLPARFCVCPRCHGHGRHDHPAFFNGITSSEWTEDWGEEEREMYLAGEYDVTCEECRGERVILEVDEDACDPALLTAYHEQLAEEAQRRHEERMGF